MSDMLLFEVRGSRGNLYEVKAYGAGPDLIIVCSCPAWKKGGKMCRHVASLLCGDVTDLASGDEVLHLLTERAAGSALRPIAFSHAPKERATIAVTSLEILRDLLLPQVEARGWEVAISETSPDGWKSLSIHLRFKNGKIRKKPAISLHFRPTDWDLVATENGIERQNWHRRQRPWVVGSVAYASLERAAAEFIEVLHGLGDKELRSS